MLYSWGSSAGFSLVDSAKVKACKSFLFTDVFSVDLVFKEELNFMLKVLDLLTLWWGTLFFYFFCWFAT